MIGQRPIPLALLALSAAAVTTAVGDAPTGIRAPVILLFVLLAPGWALVRHLRLSDPVLEAVLGLGTSIAILIVLSTCLLYAHHLSAALVLGVLAVISAVSAGLELGLQRRRRP